MQRDRCHDFRSIRSEIIARMADFRHACGGARRKTAIGAMDVNPFPEKHTLKSMSSQISDPSLRLACAVQKSFP
jgi:hypothetical protein